MTRLIGSRTVFISWMVVRSVTGTLTGTATNQVIPTSSIVASTSLLPNFIFSRNIYGSVSNIKSWVPHVVLGMQPGIVESSIIPACYASGFSPQTSDFEYGTETSSIKCSSVATGELIFKNVPTFITRSYQHFYGGIVFRRDYSRTDIFRDETVSNKIILGSSATGDHTPIPYTGTTTSTILVGSSATGIFGVSGATVSGILVSNLLDGSQTFGGIVNDSIFVRNLASGTQEFSTINVSDNIVVDCSAIGTSHFTGSIHSSIKATSGSNVSQIFNGSIHSTIKPSSLSYTTLQIYSGLTHSSIKISTHANGTVILTFKSPGRFRYNRWRKYTS